MQKFQWSEYNKNVREQIIIQKRRMNQMYQQYELPYAYDALEPYIDALTVQIHHDKHHAAYTAKLNELAKRAGVQDMDIVELCEEKENAIAQRTFANSPHKFVDKWDTPILCIHGELDYRINANQGMGAFNAARLRGIPAELLIFPDENHWVLKPQNGILWQRTFFNWLDRWLKK